MHQLTKRIHLLLIVICGLNSGLGCGKTEQIKQAVGMAAESSEAIVRIRKIPMRILLSAGAAAVHVIVEELTGLGIDHEELRKLVTQDTQIGEGLPPGDIATLMLVQKSTNDVRYWRLTDNVKTISLRTQQGNGLELKVLNETPLRIELWLDSEAKEIDVEVEMKN